jgi:hypothetical protein
MLLLLLLGVVLWVVLGVVGVGVVVVVLLHATPHGVLS